MLLRLVCLMIGYGFGLIQTSYIIGRMNGIDIRTKGSGNAGTTNAMRTLGKKAGALTLLGDMIKCALSIVICLMLFGKNHGDMIPLIKAYAAAGTILGHNFPFYLGFKGGKGIACSVILVFATSWQVGLFAALVFFGIFFTTHYVSLCSIMSYVTFFAGCVIFGSFGGFGSSFAALGELYILLFGLTFMAIYRHRANIGRLMKGTENKIYLKHKHE